MNFAPSKTIAGRSAINLVDPDGHLVATIYAQREGVHIVCQPGYAPEDLAVEVQQPTGVFVAIRPSGGGPLLRQREHT